MLEHIFLSEVLNWKSILINSLCVSICLEYVIHSLKKINLNFEQGMPLQEKELKFNEKIRIVIFTTSLVCAFPIVNSLLAIFILSIWVGDMVYLYKKDKAKQYEGDIKSLVEKCLVVSGVVLFMTILKL